MRVRCFNTAECKEKEAPGLQQLKSLEAFLKLRKTELGLLLLQMFPLPKEIRDCRVTFFSL